MARKKARTTVRVSVAPPAPEPVPPAPEPVREPVPPGAAPGAAPVATAPQPPLYKWYKHGAFHVPAQQVGEELARLEIRPEQAHRSADILEYARLHPDSALHGCFEWDDHLAAAQQRLNTARKILRSIGYVLVRGETREVQPVYVHVTTADRRHLYVHTVRLQTDAEVRRRVIDEARVGLEAWLARNHRFEEMSGVTRVIRQAVQSLAQILGTLPQSPPGGQP